jgi:hypothetical protein
VQALRTKRLGGPVPDIIDFAQGDVHFSSPFSVLNRDEK